MAQLYLEESPLGRIAAVSFGLGRLSDSDIPKGKFVDGGLPVSQLLPENSISIVRGSSKTLGLVVTDPTGKVPVDLTGARVIMTVKDYIGDTYSVIQKDTQAGPSQGEITSAREGKVKLYLHPSDTQSLKTARYVFDVWVVLSSGEHYPVIAPSVFEVVAGVTVLS